MPRPNDVSTALDSGAGTCGPSSMDPLVAELVHAMREPFLLLDSELRVVLANGACRDFFGQDDPGLRGHLLYDLVGDAAADGGLWELLERIVPSVGRVEDYPAILPGTDGPRRVLCTARTVRSDTADVAWLLLGFRPAPPQTGSDATDRLRALASAHALDGVGLYRLDGEAVYVNASGPGLLGYTRDEWLALRPCDLIQPGERSALLRAVEDAEDGAIAGVGTRARHADGEWVWIEAALRVVTDPELGLLVLATWRDVTPRRRAEEAAQWLNRQRSLVLEAAGEGIFAVDPRGVITFVNPAAASALGYAPNELTGRPYRVLLTHDAAANDLVGLTLRDGVGRRSAVDHFVGRRGAVVDVEYSCDPARLNIEVAGAVVTFRDVSERLRGHAAALRAERLSAVREMLVTLRHGINNPLTTLLAEASLLEAGGSSEQETRDTAAVIVEQARRIRDVVRDLTEADGSGGVSAATDGLTAS